MATPELTHADQRTLYETNRPAWITRAAPAIADYIRNADKAERDRAWAACSKPLRDELRRIANG